MIKSPISEKENTPKLVAENKQTYRQKAPLIPSAWVKGQGHEVQAQLLQSKLWMRRNMSCETSL